MAKDGQAERLRLLYVEDNHLLAAATSRRLGEAGFRVDVANDGDEARTLADKTSYDLALLELRLPGHMDGLSLAHWLQSRSPSMGLVMLTAVADSNSRIRALEQICDDYLIKPCEIAELTARLYAVGRRLPRQSASTVLTWGALRVDLLRNRVWAEECEVEGLQPLHVRFLLYLIQNAGRICVSVQGPKKLDHSDQLKVRDRRRKLDVIYVRGWTSSGESSS